MLSLDASSGDLSGDATWPSADPSVSVKLTGAGALAVKQHPHRMPACRVGQEAPGGWQLPSERMGLPAQCAVHHLWQQASSPRAYVRWPPAASPRKPPGPPLPHPLLNPTHHLLSLPLQATMPHTRAP